MERPAVEFAWNGEVSLAYQVVGEGPIDVLLVPGWFSNLDIQWESPYLERFLHGLSEQARLIITDRRGWGLSERFSPDDVPPWRHSPMISGRCWTKSAARGRWS